MGAPGNRPERPQAPRISSTETFEVVVVNSQVLPDLTDPGSPLFNGVVEAVRIIDLPHGLNDEVEGLRLAPWSTLVALSHRRLQNLVG